MSALTVEDRVERLVLEYAASVPAERPLDLRLSLQDDLAIESLSMVSLAVRLGDDLGVDVVELGLELGNLKTLGDLVGLARTLASSKNPSAVPHPAERHPGLSDL